MQSILRSSYILPQLSLRLVRNTIRMESTSSISAVIKKDHEDIANAYQVFKG